MVARLQNKCLILILSLLEKRDVKGDNSIVKRIMRNLPMNVLERHLGKIFKKYEMIYGMDYVIESLKHLDEDPRELDEEAK